MLMKPAQSELILYGRHDCHLCDVAEQLLQQLEPEPAYAKVDIDGQLDLLRAYGNSIPVLRAVGNSEVLCWPFDAAAVQCWLARLQAHQK